MKVRLRTRDLVAKYIDEIKVSARNKKIVRFRYGLIDNLSHTMEETGFKWGLSKQRIHQIEMAILKKIGKLT